MSKLHDCKRGLATATPRDYNRWWRERQHWIERGNKQGRSIARNRQRINELERFLKNKRISIIDGEYLLEPDSDK